MQLLDATTPVRSSSRGEGGAEQYASLLELLLSDPAVVAWLEPDADTHTPHPAYAGSAAA